MKYLSVCSGIEAASVAWHSLGWQAVGFSEIEKFPAKVLAHHYPTVPNFGDLTQHDQWPLASGSVDLLVGGTPCQSFSVAGLRRGLDDSRGQLTFEFVRLAQRLRPRWIVWENVPGVLSSGGGQDFAAFLSGLSGRDIQPPDAGWKNSGVVEPSAISNVWAKLLETNRGLQSRPVQLRGQQDRRLSSIELSRMPDERFDEQPSFYGIAWRVLDAQYFGVAQRRRRVFVVGYLGDWRRAAAVLFERESVRGDPAPSREARQRVAPSVTTGSPFSRTGNDRVEAEAIVVSKQWPAEVAPTLNAAFGTKQGLEDQHALGGAGCFVLSSGQANHSVDVNLAPALTSLHEAPIAFAQNQLGEVRIGEVFNTLNTNSNASGRNTPMVTVPIAVQAAEPLPFDTTQLTHKATGLGPNLVIGLDEEQNARLDGFGTLKARTDGGGFEGCVMIAGQSVMQSAAQTPRASMAVPIDLRNAQRDPDKHDAVNRQGTGVAKDGDPAHTVTAACVHGVAVQGTSVDPSLTASNGYTDIGQGQRIRPINATSETLRATKRGPYSDYYQTAMQVRRLTPVECERLQGFPDGYTDIRPGGKDTPDGPRYKALGNSMAVPVMRWIGERIAKVEDLSEG